MPDKLRIGKQLEPSTTPGSIVVTDSNDEQYYLAPGSAGQLLEVYDSGGGVMQLRYITPVAGATVTETTFTSQTVVNIVHSLGRVIFFKIHDGSDNDITTAPGVVDDGTTATFTFTVATTGKITWF